MDIVSIIIGAIIGLIFGGGGAYMMVGSANQKKTEEANKMADLALKEAKLTAQRKVDEAEVKAEKIISKAESKNESVKQKKIAEAKEKYSSLRSEHDKKVHKFKVEKKERELEIKSLEKDLDIKKKEFTSRIEDIETKESEVKAVRANLDKQLNIISKKKKELEEKENDHIKKLESIAQLSEQEAKEQILEAVKAKSENEAMALVKRSVTEAKETANKEAKKIVIQSIQRMCAEYTIENTVSVFNLESDDIKGQIIGREGRNIRALEAATGAEIVVDDTPEAIVISSFDPIRREVCRLSLKKLVADGRIHPARIEEVVTKTRTQLEEQIKEIGERTVIDLDIHGLDAYLVRMVGRMRFRSSYGQNLLKHSIETANLCAIMAAELGLNTKQIKMAKRGGLLHDIGKVAEEETELFYQASEDGQERWTTSRYRESSRRGERITTRIVRNEDL